MRHLLPRLFPLLLGLSACSTEEPADADLRPAPDLGGVDAGPTGPLAVVATSDFMSGALGTVNLATMEVQKARDTVDAQPVVRAFGDRVYVIDQTHGAVRSYDPKNGFKMPQEFPVKHAEVPAAQANPHSLFVDVARKRAFVTLYGSFASTAVDGGHALGVIDLNNASAGISRFLPLTVAAADPDKNPDAGSMVACGDRLYVALQDLNRNKDYSPSGPARLAVVNLAQPDAVAYIPLQGQNPVALVNTGTGCETLIVAHADEQYKGTLTERGGLELIDLVGAKSKGMGLTAKALGGNVSAMDASDLTRVFVDLVSTPDGMAFDHNVYVVNLVQRVKGQKVLGPMAFVSGVRLYRDTLLVLSAGAPKAERGHLKTGLYVGKADGSAVADKALDLGLPPISVDVVP